MPSGFRKVHLEVRYGPVSFRFVVALRGGQQPIHDRDLHLWHDGEVHNPNSVRRGF